MIHFGFLFPAFIVGFAVCYAFIYLMAKVAGKVEDVIEQAAKGG